MKIENVKIYDLEESIVASGYPMMAEIDNVNYEIDNLHQWLSYGDFLNDFINYQNKYDNECGKNTKTSCFKCSSDLHVQYNSKIQKYVCSKHNHQLDRYGEIFETTPKYIIHDNYVEIVVYGDKRKENIVLIDLEDLPKIFYKQMHVMNYCKVYNKDTKEGILLHRYIFEDLDDNMLIDHINRNKLDCRKSNLRLCNHKENSANIDIPITNTSGVIGVSYRKDKNTWRAFITVNRRQIGLGSFKIKNDAIISRLNAEKEYFGEFAPQRHLFQQYGIENIIETNLINKSEKSLNLSSAIKHMKRAIKLGHTEGTSGHNQALTGVRIAFDLTFSNKAWVELERYRFVEFVSSQSTMHRITKLDIKKQCNKYVWDSTIKNLELKVKEYNELDLFDKNSDFGKELYLEILYNVPSGFELTARLTTNYRALKTVYDQRKNHRLPEWREFCQWIEGLPYFKELVLNK